MLIGIEKMDFFEAFNWLPRLFNCTLMSAGGQPSRAVTWRFVYELKQLNVDLNQTFYLCTATDYDPSGYNIEDAFRKQFEAAIRGYGGTGRVDVHRLFVRKDQLRDKLIETQAIPFDENINPENIDDKKERNKAIARRKKNDTIWHRFCERADGGIYIPKADSWVGKVVKLDDKGNEIETDSVEDKKWVRAILEMDVFSVKLIEQELINKLLEIIRSTNDESKIMIPEIMRIFEEIRKEVSEEVYNKWKRLLIDPLIEEFLKDTEEWKEEIEDIRESERSDIYDARDNKVKEKEDEKYERVPELFNESHEWQQQIDNLGNLLEEEIQKLRDEYRKPMREMEQLRNRLTDKIDEECIDLDKDIEEIERERYEKLEEADDDYRFRTEKYDEFKEDHSAVFNPVEQSLRADIEERMSQTNLPLLF